MLSAAPPSPVVSNFDIDLYQCTQYFEKELAYKRSVKLTKLSLTINPPEGADYSLNTIVNIDAHRCQNVKTQDRASAAQPKLCHIMMF